MEAGSKAEPWLIQTGYYLVENMAMYQFLRESGTQIHSICMVWVTTSWEF